MVTGNTSFDYATFKELSNLLHVTKKIHVIGDLKGTKGIGDGIKRRVQEILKEGNLKELSSVSPDLEGMNALQNIHGVGPKLLRDLYHRDIRSIETLRSSTDVTLSIVTRIALRYHDSMNQRIPRALIDDVYRYLRDEIPVEFDICGSYRRGAETSGDIDILVKSDDALRSLAPLIQSLTDKEFLVATLSSGTNSYQGICRFRDRYCRIDFLLTKEDEYAAALLHFTGSGLFNQIIRFHANKQGYKLSNLGLFCRDTMKKLHGLDTEKAIFDKLNVEYLEPHERNL